jgi:ABC-type antimicrobial peptide transport system permease subunit
LSIDLIVFLAQFGIILAVIINILQIISYLTFSIKESEKSSIEDRENPYWKRKYLDIIMLGIGLTFYLITIYSIDVNTIPPVLLTTLSAPAPIMIMIGSVMFTARIFPYFTIIFSSILWKKRGKLISFSLMNIVRRRHSLTRSLLIISLAFAFLITFLAFPQSFLLHQETVLKYDIGSEIQISLDDEEINYPYFDSLFEGFKDEIEAYTPIITGKLIGNPFIAINTSTFESASWMRNDFISDLSASLEDLSSDNSSLLLYKENLEASKRELGQSFVWSGFDNEIIDQEFIGKNFVFNVKATFDYWPNLLIREPLDPRTRFYGVFSLNTLNSLNNEIDDQSTDSIEELSLKLYVKPKNTLNQSIFKQHLLKISGIENVRLLSEENYHLENNIGYITLIGQLNNDVFYTIGTILLVITMFGFIQLIERSKEIATEKALGMTLTQNFGIILLESFWLLIIGLIAGLFLGLFFSSIFLLVVTLGFGFPPFIMVYPIPLIGSFVLLFILFTILFSFIPAYLSLRIDVTKLLRVE